MKEFFDQLFLILTNGAIVLGVFVVLLINNKGVRKSRANAFLSILLLALTFNVFHLRYAANLLSHFSLNTYFIGDPTFLVIAPLLWLYIKELTGDQVTLYISYVFHFIPFLVISLCSIIFSGIDNPMITFLNHHPRLPVTIFWMIVVLQFSCYQFLIHRKWASYQHVIRQEVSNTEDVNISWVRFFMGVFLIVNVFLLAGLFAVIHLDFMSWIWNSVGVIFSLSIVALGYKGILQKEIFNSSLILTPAIVSKQEPSKAEKPNQHLIEKLIGYMEDKRPFLDPELSLSMLSKSMGMNRSQLSSLINDGIGENFYDFVNKYRVEEVKRLMTDPQAKNYNLLGIALEAGFKSKSTFNLIFKRFTGLTPTEYRKNITSRDVQ